MKVMSPKPALSLFNRGTSHILMGSRLLSSSTVKIKEGFYFEMARLSTAASAGDPNDIVPSSSVETENISYNSKAIKQHMKANVDETTTTDNLFNCEETELAAASAADVMGFAEEALKVAKNSTDLVGEHKNFEDIRSEEDLVICEQSRLAEKEKPKVVKALDHFRFQATEDESSSNVAGSCDFLPPFVRKRMTRRLKAGVKIAKVATAVKSRKRNRRSKHVIACLLDLANAPHVVRDSINSKLLTGTEVTELSKGTQDWLKLERIRLRLVAKTGHQPTLNRWAKAAGTDHKTLRNRLIVGQYCRQKLFRSNLGLVKFFSYRYEGLGISSEDLFQLGCMGLVKGVDRFDYTKGFRFSTYAQWCIRGPIRRALCTSSGIFSYTPDFFFAMLRVERAKRRFCVIRGRRPRVGELARITGLSVETLRLALRHIRIRNQRWTISLDNIADPNAENIEDTITKQQLITDVAKSFDVVTKKEKDVLRLRYGFDGGKPKSLGDIGDLFNYSREGIRLMEKRALRKIREYRSYVLTPYISFMLENANKGA